MGEWAHAKRNVIVSAFEACCGDMQGDVEPIMIFRRHDANDHVLELRQVQEGSVLRVSYTIVGGPFDVADIEHIYAITYLDEFTMHHYQGKVTSIAFRNAGTGDEHTMLYPDPE